MGSIFAREEYFCRHQNLLYHDASPYFRTKKKSHLKVPNIANHSRDECIRRSSSKIGHLMKVFLLAHCFKNELHL